MQNNKSWWTSWVIWLVQKKTRKKDKKDNNYTTKDHGDWVDEENFGISHFGLSPSIFPRENIRFDVFTYVL